MPNWCQNSLYIRGPKGEIQRFLDGVKTKDSGFDFNTSAPFPEKFRRGKAEEQADEWCLRNWGTKWRIDDTSLTILEIVKLRGDNEFEVELEFETAWSPPIPVILEASRRFTELEFDLRYSDPPTALGGIYRAKNGFDAHADCSDLVVWDFNMS
jgi:hypothetical protein